MNALKRAVQIVDYHQKEVSTANRAAVYIALGDMYMMNRDRKDAIATYQQAMKILDTVADSGSLKKQYFDRPKRLQYRKPRPVPNSIGKFNNYTGTFAEASFVVRENGSVDHVELLASNAPTPMRTLFRKALRRAIYRPRFVDGEPIATPEFLREEFAGTALPANASPAGN